VVLVPALNLTRPSGKYTVLDYDPKDVVKALQSLLSSSGQFSGVSTYRYDVVDITRQTLSDVFIEVHDNLSRAYYDQDYNTAMIYGRCLVNVLEDLDAILASDANFLLGTWIKDARAWGSSDAESNYYEFNARNQITLWGPNGEIEDYANKLWGGLVGDYYYERWIRYVDQVLFALYSGTPYDQGAFYSDLLAWEQQWQYDTNGYPTTPVGDSIAIAKQLVAKYFSGKDFC